MEQYPYIDYINTMANTGLQERITSGKDEDTKKKESNDPCPWLEQDSIRRNMSGPEMIETYVDLSNACLTKYKRNRYTEPW